jgi:protein-tyrosine phosphatase
MPRYVDLHSHVLPAIDDGARSLDETRAMLTLLAQLGFSEVCATPHQKAAQFLPTRDEIANAYAGAQTMAAQIPGLTLLLGAENYWDDVFFARARERCIPSYTGGRAFLVEIPPQQTPLRFEDHLFAQRARGLLPVLAHPERYPDLCGNLERMRAVARIVALVVDLGALHGAHGKREARSARELCELGIAHAAASDVHSPTDVQSAAGGIAWIRKHLGDAACARLLEDNPRRILQGELPE